MLQQRYSYSPWLREDLSVWNNLTYNLQPKFYEKETLVFQQQDILKNLYIIASGRVRITLFDHDGNEKAIYIAEEGTLIGEEAIILEHPLNTSAIVIVDSYIYEIPVADLFNKIHSDHRLNSKIMKLLAYKNMMLINHLEELSFCDAFQRVVITLYNLVQRYGVEIEEGIKINIKFTHEELSGIVNTSRVTVNNICTDLTNRGIMYRYKGHYIFRDVDCLIKLIEFS